MFLTDVRIQLANKNHLLPSLAGAAAVVIATGIEAVPPVPIKQEQPEMPEVGVDPGVRDVS